MSNVDSKIKYEFLRKSKKSNKGTAVYFDAKKMIFFAFPYIINSMKILDKPYNNNVIFLKPKINTWEDNISDFKNWLLKNKKGELLLLTTESTSIPINDIKKFIAKLLID